jgi:hypothetical protein
MNMRTTLARPTKAVMLSLSLVAVASLMIGWTAGTVAASSGSRTAAPSTAPAVQHGAALVDGTNVPTTATLPGTNDSTSGGASSGPAMYPVTGYNSLGVAPQGTILTEGNGTADMKANGSDQAASLKKATDAAIADAHTQAAVTATSMGVTLGDIYSISVVANTNYAYPTPDCVVNPGLEKGATASAGTGAVSNPASSPAIAPIQECVAPTATAPTSAQVVVTVIVAYKFS